MGNIPGSDVAKGETLSAYIGSGPPKDTGNIFIKSFTKMSNITLINAGMCLQDFIVTCFWFTNNLKNVCLTNHALPIST